MVTTLNSIPRDRTRDIVEPSLLFILSTTLQPDHLTHSSRSHLSLTKVPHKVLKDLFVNLEEIKDDIVESASVAMQVESMPCVRLYVCSEIGRSRESLRCGLQDAFTIATAEG